MTESAARRTGPPEPSMDYQQSFWDDWNSAHREDSRTEISLRQARVVLEWLARDGRRDLRILEVGCGSGWFSAELCRFGSVTATDLSPKVLDRARARYPAVTFVVGDFGSTPFAEGEYDVVVSLEVLSHVADQPAFMAKIASLLRPGGRLMLATQNRPVLQNRCRVPPPDPGQVRHWVDRRELRAVAAPHFVVDELASVTPVAHRWPYRALTSWRLHAALGPVGRTLRSQLEARDWGWTLMFLGHRRAAGAADTTRQGNDEGGSA